MKRLFRDSSSDKYAWVLFFIGLGIIFSVISLPGCKNSMPAIDVNFWAGDSAKDGISRSQDSKTIKASDPSFDDYVCLSYDDLKKVFALIQECQEWPSDRELIELQVALQRLKKQNPEVYNHVIRPLLRSQKRLEPLPA